MRRMTPAPIHRACFVLWSMGGRLREEAPCVAIQCLAACSMQKRVAGIASSRAAPIGFPQTSQLP